MAGLQSGHSEITRDIPRDCDLILLESSTDFHRRSFSRLAGTGRLLQEQERELNGGRQNRDRREDLSHGSERSVSMGMHGSRRLASRCGGRPCATPPTSRPLCSEHVKLQHLGHAKIDPLRPPLSPEPEAWHACMQRGREGGELIPLICALIFTCPATDTMYALGVCALCVRP